MTHENKEPNNELDELELQELLKPHEPSVMPGDRSRSRRSENEKSAPRRSEAHPSQNGRPAQRPDRDADRTPAVTEKRKRALVWYMVGLFGIAFLLVLGSLWLRPGMSAEDAEALQALETRVQQLEAENKQLTLDNEDLSMQIYNLEHNMVQMAGTNEYIEGEAAISGAEAEILTKKMEAYSLLVKAQNALIDFDRDTLTETMDALAERYTYLDDNAMNAYYTIMEQMEQPYQGQ